MFLLKKAKVLFAFQSMLTNRTTALDVCFDNKMGPPQDRRGRGQEEEEGSTLPPLQDKRRSGNVSDGKEEEDAMDTSKPERNRKRKKSH
jgi:hypothetical protein